MITKSLRVFAVAVLALGGCASGPGYLEVADSIPELSSDSGRIYFYRIATMGAAVQPEVKLNDEVVGRAKPKGFFYVDRPEGDYVVSASTEAKRSLSLTLRPGDEKYVRLEMKMGIMAGHVKPVLVEPSVGRSELERTKSLGAAAE